MFNQGQIKGVKMNTCGVLLILFIVLKILAIINWSWWWVLSPLWLPIVGILGFLLVIAIGGGIAMLVAHLCDKRKVNKK